jgi:hypothetical protein
MYKAYNLNVFCLLHNKTKPNRPTSNFMSILPFMVGGVVCQTDGEWELAWVIVLPEIIGKLFINILFCNIIVCNIFYNKVEIFFIKKQYKIDNLPFREDSDVTAADGAMMSLPMVPFEG